MYQANTLTEKLDGGALTIKYSEETTKRFPADWQRAKDKLVRALRLAKRVVAAAGDKLDDMVDRPHVREEGRDPDYQTLLHHFHLGTVPTLRPEGDTSGRGRRPEHLANRGAVLTAWQQRGTQWQAAKPSAPAGSARLGGPAVGDERGEAYVEKFLAWDDLLRIRDRFKKVAVGLGQPLLISDGAVDSTMGPGDDCTDGPGSVRVVGQARQHRHDWLDAGQKLTALHPGRDRSLLG